MKVSSTASKAGKAAKARSTHRAPVQARSTKSPVWESTAGPHIYTGPSK